MKATTIPHTHTLHGDVRHDPYHWLRNRADPNVIAYLETENAYLKAHGPSPEFQASLYQELLARVKPADSSVPVQDGPYWYYSRFEAGQQHQIYCRKKAKVWAELETAPEEILLDVNALAEGKTFCEVSQFKISDDHRWAAYALDSDGSANNTIYFKNLETHELLPERISNIESYASLVWAADSCTLYYLVMDDAHRSCELRRHTLGTDISTDLFLYREEDITFRLFLSKSSDRKYLFLKSTSRITNEMRYLRSDDISGAWQVFAPRIEGIEYFFEHSRDHFVFTTNENAVNFKLMSVSTSNSSAQNAQRENWNVLIPHRDDVLLEQIQPLRDHLVLYGRVGGLTQVWVQNLSTQTIRALQFPGAFGTVYPGDQREFNSPTARIDFTSLTTPNTVFDVNLETLECTVLKREEIANGYDETQFESQHLWVVARDGVRVPVSLVAKRGVLQRGTAPLLLDGYGSYGSPFDPMFSQDILSLLERGVVYAIAHVRGGNEMGRTWYTDGKLMRKCNTFTDFIDCAESLIAQGITLSDKLAATGASAGGLLMGAVVNMRPELFKAVVAEVPFMDVVTTMLDASIPLTTLEWDEWGDPRTPEAYAYMRAYSPYDNLEAKAYPHLLVTTGLNDPRVAYWEPAKYVARLRELKTDQNDLFLYTNLDAGHGGASGRFDRLREVALKFAFVLERISPGSQ
jgi:oligopeptidase B